MRYTVVVIVVLFTAGGCGTIPAINASRNAPQLDWNDIVRRATIVFDMNCLSQAALVVKYAADNPQLIVLPEGNRVMLLHGTSGEVRIFLPGLDQLNDADLRADLQASPDRDEELGANFHTGMLRRARQLRRRLEGGSLSQIVHLTGYSTGGATAVILGLYLDIDGFTVDTLTFGQFPVTDALGSAKFAGKYLLRVKSGLDGVPDLYGDMYSHFGDMLVLLDGPLFAYLRQGDLGFTEGTRLFHSVNPFVDHFTYPARLRDKLLGTVQVFSLSTAFVTDSKADICLHE